MMHSVFDVLMLLPVLLYDVSGAPAVGLLCDGFSLVHMLFRGTA